MMPYSINTSGYVKKVTYGHKSDCIYFTDISKRPDNRFKSLIHAGIECPDKILKKYESQKLSLINLNSIGRGETKNLRNFNFISIRTKNIIITPWYNIMFVFKNVFDFSLFLLSRWYFYRRTAEGAFSKLEEVTDS